MKFLQKISVVIVLLVAYGRAAVYIENPLHDKVPPTIIGERQEEILFTTGEPFRLECDAEGKPPPRYDWIKDSEKFDPSTQEGRITQEPGKGTLIFHDPQPSDEGRYACIAQNTVGGAITMTMVKNKDKENASHGQVLRRSLRSSRSILRAMNHIRSKRDVRLTEY